MEINPGKQEEGHFEPSVKKQHVDLVEYQFYNVVNEFDFFDAGYEMMAFVPFLEGLYNCHQAFKEKEIKPTLRIPVDLEPIEWEVLKLYVEKGRVHDDENAVSILNFFGVQSESVEPLNDFHRIRLEEWYARNFMAASKRKICDYDMLEHFVNKIPNFAPTVNREDVAIFHSPNKLWNIDRKVVLAGGSLVSLLLNEPVHDYDLFLVNVADDDELLLILEELHTVFANTQGMNIYSAYFNSNTWTWTLGVRDQPKQFQNLITFQIVFRNYKSVQEIMLGFDLDPCCIVYDGNNFMISKRAQWAFRNHAMVVDHTRISLSHAQRMWKYWKRGFDIIIPGLSMHSFKLPKNIGMVGKYAWCIKCVNNAEDGTTEIAWKKTRWCRRRRRTVASQIIPASLEAVYKTILNSVHDVELQTSMFTRIPFSQFNAANVVRSGVRPLRTVNTYVSSSSVQYTTDEQQQITNWMQSLPSELGEIKTLNVIIPGPKKNTALGYTSGLDLLVFFIFGIGLANISASTDYTTFKSSPIDRYPVLASRKIVLKYGHFFKIAEELSCTFPVLMQILRASDIMPNLNFQSPMQQHTSSFHAKCYNSMQKWLNGKLYGPSKEVLVQKKIVVFDL